MNDNISYLPWVTPPGQESTHKPPETPQPHDSDQTDSAESVYADAKKIAIQALARSDKSRSELAELIRRKLTADPEHNRDLVEEAIFRTIDECEENKWLNEARAIETAGQKMVNQGKSSGMIRQKLEQRGFVRQHIDEFLQTRDSAEEFEQLQAVTLKRYQQLRDYPPEVQKRRLYSFLQRRGYSSSHIQKALSELF